MPQAEKQAAAEPKQDKATRPAPSADEQARITTKSERRGNNVTMRVEPAHADLGGAWAHLIDTFGTRSTEAADALISQLANAVAPNGTISDAQLNGALAA